MSFGLPSSDPPPPPDTDPVTTADVDAPPQAPPPTTINPLALRLNGPAADVTLSEPLDLAPPVGWVEDPDQPMEDVHHLSDPRLSKGDYLMPRPRRLRPNPLKYGSMRTGICYDVRMRFHATVDEDDMHPEDPRRILEIYKAICDAGLVDDPMYTGVVKRDDLMIGIRARLVTMEEALLVHTREHWDFLSSTVALEHEQLQELTRDGDSVYFNGESFFCSKLSCGGAIETCDAVVSGKVKNAIAVIRPPGHHAEPHKAMGFCLFNNVCVATKVMQKKYPDKCKKVLILDWDVHHGNGTQTAFYDDPSVLYMSIHRYSGGKFYPEGPQGNYDHCGVGDGVGMNVNVPWASGGMGDGDYMYAFQRVIMPIAMEFDPDLVIVSAGFDAAAGDTLGGCFVTPAGYAHMTHMLMALADGKVVVCLEGGYNLQSISNSALAVTKVLMGEPPGKLHDGHVACKSAVEVVHTCVIKQSNYWRCMRPRDIIPEEHYEEKQFLKAIKLNDMVRIYQAKNLWDKYRMSVLPIYRDRISESFTFQVIARSDFFTKETIVFFVHDPYAPMLDAGVTYVDWAISKDYGFVDANIPHRLSGIENDGYDAQKQTEELCIYLWDNYLDVSEAKNIFLIGVGDAVLGLINLLVNRDCRDKVRGVVSFLGENHTLRAVVPPVANEYLTEWYYHNSRILISHAHSVWSRPKLPRKKFGALVKSKGLDVHEIMLVERDMITQWIEEQMPVPTAEEEVAEK